jgi:hypothetical protein
MTERIRRTGPHWNLLKLTEHETFERRTPALANALPGRPNDSAREGIRPNPLLPTWTVCVKFQGVVGQCIDC